MIGQHLLADFYEAAPEPLRDLRLLEECLRVAAVRCGLTPLAPAVMHQFEGGGVTGFILLSESHISLHTYPERRFMALDVFSCGERGPEGALEVFRHALHPARIQASIKPRGGEAA